MLLPLPLYLTARASLPEASASSWKSPFPVPVPVPADTELGDTEPTCTVCHPALVLQTWPLRLWYATAGDRPTWAAASGSYTELPGQVHQRPALQPRSSSTSSGAQPLHLCTLGHHNRANHLITWRDEDSGRMGASSQAHRGTKEHPRRSTLLNMHD